MASRPPKKPFYCAVISETVSIAARRRRSLDGRGEMFVQCSEVDCQYVDANVPPCPLTLDLVADDLRERARPELPRP